MAGLSSEAPEDPSQLVIRAYWQNMGASDDYRPNDWRRPEFREGQFPAYAREMLTQWMCDQPYMIRAVRGLRDGVVAGGDRHRAGEAVAAWLDAQLYGHSRDHLPDKDDRISVQLVADSITRRDFCRMDFGRLMDDVCAVDV